MAEKVDAKDLRRFYLYRDCQIYGPYKWKDGRERVVIVFPNGNRRLMSYPKYLMEQHLDRKLLPDETVDHINGNFMDNNFENMRVITRTKHVYEDVIRKKPVGFKCPICSKHFSLSGKRLNNAIRNRKQEKVGPFCGRSCAGKYGKSIQLGAQKGVVALIIPEYTTIKTELSLLRETDEVDTAKTGNP